MDVDKDVSEADYIKGKDTIRLGKKIIEKTNSPCRVYETKVSNDSFKIDIKKCLETASDHENIWVRATNICKDESQDLVTFEIIFINGLNAIIKTEKAWSLYPNVNSTDKVRIYIPESLQGQVNSVRIVISSNS